MEKNKENRFDRAVVVFKRYGGILRTGQALHEGIHPATLYAMRDSGVLETISRGVYRLAGCPLLVNPDLVTVATRLPHAVVCLISALAFYEITTQVPHQIDIALPRGAEEPLLDYPPIKTYRFTGQAFTEGVMTHVIDGVNMRIYSPEKTLADCFKFRNRIGLDTVIEAVRLYRAHGPIRIDDLMHYATICRVDKVIRPYLEALL